MYISIDRVKFIYVNTVTTTTINIPIIVFIFLKEQHQVCPSQFPKYKNKRQALPPN